MASYFGTIINDFLDYRNSSTNDILDGGLGADIMYGGDGDDIYYVDNLGDVVEEFYFDALAGYDWVISSVSFTLHSSIEKLSLTGSGSIDGTGNANDNDITGNFGNNLLSGLDGNDTISGLGGTDTLNGGLGNDVLKGGLDNDTLDGGAGSDTADYSDNTVAVVVALNGATPVNVTSGVETDSIVNIENINGGSGDDTITGDFESNMLSGNGGNDTLRGGAGVDTIYGGDGDDLIESDNASGTDFDNTFGGNGNDTFRVTGQFFGANFDGGADIDTLDVSLFTFTSGYLIDLGAGTWREEPTTGNWSVLNVENANGSNNDDVIVGSIAANVLNGNGGVDSINGGDGDDLLKGGLGNDTLDGGTGSDTADYSDNADAIAVALDGATPVNVTSGAETDSIVNIEKINGGSGGDTITGDGNANTLNGNGGSDTIAGGDGDDTISGGDGDDTLTGGLGVDTLYGGDGNDTLNNTPAEAAEFSYGGAGDDTIYAVGTTFSGAHFGDAGNDRIVIDPGYYAGDLDGGADIDTVDASAVTAFGFTFDLAAGTLLDNGNLFNLIAFENVTGGQLADTIIGSSSANTLDGQGGDDNISGGDGTDTITGGDGNDLLNGGAQIDSLTGGLGDDTLVVESAADAVFEAIGGGTDTVITSQTYALAAGQEIERLQTNNQAALLGLGLIGNEFANRLTANAGNNTLNGGAGIDLMFGLGGNDTYYVDNAADVVGELVGGGTDQVLASVTYTLAGGQEVETLKTTNDAGLGNINLTGNEFNNSMTGNAGNNVLTGGLGSDTMRGLGGNDSFVVDNAGDVVIELVGNGTDTVFASVSFALQSGQEIENLQTNNAAAVTAINLTGNNLNNIITGNAGNNTLNGGLGVDTLTGLGGNDLYIVENSLDVVVEAIGGGTDTVNTIVNYTLGGGREIEVLQTGSAGSTDALTLTGNEFAQTIIGNAGNNTLNGRLGLDTLNGGNGQDNFVFDTALGAANIDTITSFIVADDTIVLENAIFTALGVGALLAGAFNGGAVATQADDRILYNSATKALLYDADGVGGVAAIQFATLSSISGALSAADFLIV